MFVNIAANLVIALICTAVVNLLGKLFTYKGYTSLDREMDTAQRSFNVTFRVVTPIVIWCPISCLAASVFVDYQPIYAWISLAIYWVIRFLLTILLNPASLDPAGLIARSIVCCLIGSYFSVFLVSGDPSCLIPEKSDVVFQFWLFIGMACIAIIAGMGDKRIRNNLEKYYYEVERYAEKLLPQIHINLLDEARIRTRGRLPNPAAAGLHAKGLLGAIVVDHHLTRKRGPRTNEAHPFCQDEKTLKAPICWIIGLTCRFLYCQWHRGQRIAPANRGYRFAHNKNARRRFEGSGQARRRPLSPKQNRPNGTILHKQRAAI